MAIFTGEIFDRVKGGEEIFFMNFSLARMIPKLIYIPLMLISMTAALSGCSGKPQHSWGYIDRAGKVVIPAQFAEGREFSDGIAAVKIQGNWGYIDRTGKVVIPVQFAGAQDFANELAAVKIQGS